MGNPWVGNVTKQKHTHRQIDMEFPGSVGNSKLKVKAEVLPLLPMLRCTVII